MLTSVSAAATTSTPNQASVANGHRGDTINSVECMDISERPLHKSDPTAVRPDEVREALTRILDSRIFESAPAQRRLLAYVVEKTLAGGSDLKEFSLAIDVFGRTADFDPRKDSIVRIEARKLRFNLQKYYEGEAALAPLRIELPKGHYIPRFSDNARPESLTSDTKTKQPLKFSKKVVALARFRTLRFNLGYAAPVILALLVIVALSAYRFGFYRATIKDGSNSILASSSPAAQNDLLLGQFWGQKIAPESMDTAIRYFQSAISKDPKSAAAYVGLGESYVMHARMNGSRWAAAEVRSAALKALAINRFDAEAHTALAQAYELDFDWSSAEREFRSALLLQPNSARAHSSYGALLVKLNRLNEAQQELALAADLDRSSSILLGATALPYYMERRFEKAVEIYKKALSMDSDSGVLHQWLGISYLSMGRYTEGLQETLVARKLLQGDILTTGQLGHAYALSGKPELARLLLEDLSIRPGFVASAIAEVYIGLRDNELALDWLEKAFDEKDVWLRPFQDPIYDTLRSEPRFQRFASAYTASIPSH